MLARQPNGPEELGKQPECPVCMSLKRLRQGSHAVFPCKHALCMSCLTSLVQARGAEAACPLCRIALVMPAEKGGQVTVTVEKS